MQRHDTFAILPNVATHEQIHRLAITIQEQWPAACSPASPARRGWSDLTEDILDMVYGRFCFSSYDRACFTSVCSSWRTVASWHPTLPALPLLHPLTGDAKAQAYSLEDGRALHVPLPGYPSGRRLVGAHDGDWVAAAAGVRLLIVNVFSGASQSAALCQTKHYWM
jgi:hypothetical protein